MPNEQKSESSRWTVYFHDTFDHTKWSETFETEEEARERARFVTANTDMLTAHVDNPSGKLVGRLGRY